MSATLYCTKTEQDSRGNDQLVVDTGHHHDVSVWEYPQRGGIAEVAGDQQIRSTRIGFGLVDPTGAEIESFGVKAQVVFPTGSPLEGTWDVVTPPAYHHGTRHTRHWSCDIKWRA